MQIIKVLGGLGNQLFQYSFGKALEEHTGLKVYYDIEDFDIKYKLRKNNLKHFNITPSIADPKDVARLTSVYNKAIYKVYDMLNGAVVNKNSLKYYSEKGLLFNEDVFSLNNDIYLNGYWQSEKYFSKISSIIRNDLQIITPPDDINLATINKIENSNSISLHIRRGDYVSNPSLKNIYYNCSIEYYEKAMDYIAEHVNEPLFFIFSDDIAWAKANLKSKYNMIFIDANDADHSYEDLRLMSLCKHNITANSTFSWWGAWLNNTNNKIVITPKQWFKEGSYSSADLIPQGWNIL